MAIIHHPSLARYSLFNPSLVPFDKNLPITFVDNEKGVNHYTATGGKLQLEYSSDGLLEWKIDSKHEFYLILSKNRNKKPRIELASQDEFLFPEAPCPGSRCDETFIIVSPRVIFPLSSMIRLIRLNININCEFHTPCKVLAISSSL